MNILRVAGLVWAEAVMEGTFFIMQLYLTTVWKMSFTNAAGFLNIWGGIYRILPLFFLFLADAFLGNFITLTFSAISSTTGAVLITVATAPVLGKSISGGACEEKGEGATCVGHTEKVVFILGMALIALGRAAHVASVQPFINDQTITNGNDTDTPIRSCLSYIAFIIFLITPLVVVIAFPYVKRWDVLFGVSAACTAMATLFYLSGIHTYNRCGPNQNGSPITDIFRVLVAAALKRSQPLIPQENIQLHRIDDQEEFKDFSASRTLRFLNKAAIILAGEDEDEDAAEVKKSWKLCSVSQVESTKAIIRMVPMWCAFIMCGVVSSAGNTYFVEQASHMDYKSGRRWEIQVILLVFVLFKYTITLITSCTVISGKAEALANGLMAILSSVVCCTVAAAVERRRLHVVRRHHLLDTPDDATVPMSIVWITYQVVLLAFVDVLSQCSLSAFHLSETPKSMRRYKDCFSEAVASTGFICSALSVYVVGKISEAGGGNNWFQYTLNRSRLDRYYWVLSVLTALNLIAFTIIVLNYKLNKRKKVVNEDGEINEENVKRAGSELFGIKKSSAVGLICTYIFKLNEQNPTHISNRAPIGYLKKLKKALQVYLNLI